MDYKLLHFSKIFLRLALAAGYLSAVADRLGWWGKAQSVWGNWESFVMYTKKLLPYLPDKLATASAFAATALEVVIGIGLIIGFKTRFFALLSGVLLLVFALSMAFTLGIKAPLDYSVFTGAAASFVLAGLGKRSSL